MSDQFDVKLNIGAVDNTGSAIDSAIRRAQDATKQFGQTNETVWRSLAARAKDSQKPLEDLAKKYLETTKATEALGATTKKVFGGDIPPVLKQAGEEITNYVTKFLSIGAAAEVVRRSIVAYAEAERGMTRIRLETGATADQIHHLSDTFEELSKKTGQTTAALQASFRNFADYTSAPLEEVAQVFERVTIAAYATGTSLEGMTKLAGVAINNLKVPMNEVSDVLDTWVKVIPTSMMDAFTAAAPRIMATLRDVGFTGKESAEQVGGAFTSLAQALGNTRLAASAMEGLMRKATDASSGFGMMLIPMLQQIQQRGGGSAEAFESIYQKALQLGVYSEDLMKRQVMRGAWGWSEQDARAAQIQHDHFVKVDKLAKELGMSFGEAARRYGELTKDPESGMERLGAAIEKVTLALGKLFGQDPTSGLTQLINNTAHELELLKQLFEWFSKNVPSGTIEDRLNQQRDNAKQRLRIPGFQSGTSYVEQTGPAMLHQGEMVVPASQADLMGEYFTQLIQHPTMRVLQSIKKDRRRRGQPLRTEVRRQLGIDDPGEPSYFEGRGYAGGTAFVPETGPAMLHQGEMVIPQREAAMARGDVLAGQQGQYDIAQRAYFASFRDRGTAQGDPNWLAGGDWMTGGGAGGGSGGGGGGGGGYGGGAYGGAPGRGYGGVPAMGTRNRPGNDSGSSPGGVSSAPSGGGGSAPGGGGAGVVTSGGDVRLGEKGAHGYARGGTQVEPWLVDTVRQASRALPPGYRADVISTVDPRAKGTPWHPSGRAIDIQIFDDRGNKVPYIGNRGVPGYGVYENMALAARQYTDRVYPGKTFTWGGHFHSGTPYDRMHFQSGGVSAEGFSKQQLSTAVLPDFGVAGGAAASGASGAAASGAGSGFKHTFYAPGASGLGGMEGPYATSRSNPNREGAFLPTTLDDVREARAQGRDIPVTLAGDPRRYGETHELGTITYRGKDGNMYTLDRVSGYVHDTGGAFKGRMDKLDIAAIDARGMNDATAARQLSGDRVVRGSPQIATTARPVQVAGPGASSGGAAWPPGTSQGTRDAHARALGGSVAAGKRGGGATHPDQEGGVAAGKRGGGAHYKEILSEHRAAKAELEKPIEPTFRAKIPQIGPVSHRFTRHAEHQREQDVNRMERHSAHADIGFA